MYEQFFSVPSEKPEAPGVFVEMGALDGVTLSNTLAFERSRMNWTGDQANVEKLMWRTSPIRTRQARYGRPVPLQQLIGRGAPELGAVSEA